MLLRKVSDPKFNSGALWNSKALECWLPQKNLKFVFTLFQIRYDLHRVQFLVVLRLSDCSAPNRCTSPNPSSKIGVLFSVHRALEVVFFSFSFVLNSRNFDPFDIKHTRILSKDPEPGSISGSENFSIGSGT